MAELAGYAHPDYCASLSEFGDPLRLPNAGASLLERPIPQSRLRDAMGPYPLLACADWSRLSEDLESLSDTLVSVTAVSDPLGSYDAAMLRSAFPDLMRPYKDHFIVDLTVDPDRRTSRHHRRNVRLAQGRVTVERAEQPHSLLNDWTTLYAGLVRKRHVRGIAAFSRDAFKLQLAVPGLKVFRARIESRTIGMLLFYVHGDKAYYHLGSFSEEGYQAGAAFALFQAAMDWFTTSGCRTLLLGGAAGTESDDFNGLTRFKRGWATGTATAYLCGRILDREAYERLSACSDEAYFPRYRSTSATNIDDFSHALMAK